MAKSRKAGSAAEATQDGGALIPDEIMTGLIEQFIVDAGSDNVAVFGGRYEGGIHCQHIPDELAAFLKFIMDSGTPIQAYLDISNSVGAAVYIVNQFLAPEKIVLIDNNLHWAAPKRAEVLSGIDRLEIVGDSRSPDTIAKAGYAYDLVIIDGERTYEGVMADAKNYIPLVRAGGFIAVHDSTLKDRGITQAVEEMKGDPGLEFVAEFLSTKRAPLGMALFRKAAE